MTRVEHQLTGMLQTLVYSLSNKIVRIDGAIMEKALSGEVISFQDIDHFQIVFSDLTGRALLIGGERQDVKAAWGQCKATITSLERHVSAMRLAKNAADESAERRTARNLKEKNQ